MAATPWAILLCKFSDVSPEPYPRSRYEEIFTTAGAGKSNMVDFFHEMSHGHVDLSGSRVFPANGWYQLAQKQSDYAGSGLNPKGRGDLISWARQAAAKAGDDLSGFFNVVVTTNAPSDLFGGLGGVVADDGRKTNGMTQLSPSLLGQEMGHGYGLDHSRMEGSTLDYQDGRDVMSTPTNFMAPHPAYTEVDDKGRPIFLIGPGLNAANMWAMGWLDLTRTWTGWAPGATTPELDGSVELRPLHRLDLPGYLCARLGDLFIEFRMNERWDAGIGNPIILIHDYFDGHSYIHFNDTGQPGLVSGESLSQGYTGDPAVPIHGAGFRITVSNIDANARIATIQIKTWASNIPGPVGPGIPFWGVTNDGGGRVLINGKLVVIPPRTPEFTVLELIAEARESQAIRNGVARGIALQQVYEAIRGIAAAQTAGIQAYREPAPLHQENE
jgi:hypothetical protein